MTSRDTGSGRHLQAAPDLSQERLDELDDAEGPVDLSRLGATLDEALASSAAELDALLASFPAEERAAAAGGVYHDAEGRIRTTYRMLGSASAGDGSSAPRDPDGSAGPEDSDDQY